MHTEFNDSWKFWKDGEENNKIAVTLPHDAMLHEKRTPDALGKSASAFFPGGIYFYERELDVTPDMSDKHLLLEFEGVYKNAEVYVNDCLVKKAAYGYAPFFVNLDGVVHSGKNTIRVKADNHEQPDSRWYSGAGIYRPVTLHIRPMEHILCEGVKIKTVSIGEPAEIEISAEHTEGIERVDVQILDAEGRAVASCGLQRSGNIQVRDHLTAVISRGKCHINEAKLWSSDTPYLYTACVMAFAKGGSGNADEPIQTFEQSFGIRTIEWSPKGLLINGKTELLRGGCVHHDNGILGSCAYREAEERRVRLLKEAGYNAIRSAHNPCSKAMLDACDRYGVYMMDELYDMWYKHKSKYDYAREFNENFESDIELFVRRDYNHPSVIFYSIGNEVSEPATEKGVELSKKMVGLLHELDDTRAVTAGYNLMIIKQSAGGKDMYDGDEGGMDDDKGKKTDGMNSTLFNMMASMVGTGMNKAANGKKADAIVSPGLDALDIAGYNYASGRYPLDGKLHPNRVIFGSETFPQDIAKNWTMVKKYPYLIGDFMWVSWDYLGEAGIGAWSYHPDAKGFEKPYPWLLGGTGAFDIIGNTSGSLYLAQAAWGVKKDPIIGVQPCNHPNEKLIKSVWRGSNAMESWAWSGCDGNRVVVEVFADADKVELSLNGKSLGKKRVKNCVAMFKIKYAPGTLTAISYDASGNCVGESSLTSTTGKISVAAEPEKNEAAAGEVVFVPIRIVGENGVTESNADERLTVTVEGGELLGFGSANPRTEESFLSGNYSTFYGHALAAVRANTPGILTVRARGEREDTAEARINIV